MQSMKKQRALYFRYGTRTPDKEFRTMNIDGVPKVMSIREIVRYRERSVKELEAQRKQIKEARGYNLKRKEENCKQIEDCRKHNPKQKVEISIEDMIAHINKMGTIG